MDYPVSFQADYVERRSRLSVFFRFILLIPLFIWLYVYGIVTAVAVIIAWLVIVITGRLPDGLYRFIAGYLRVLSLVTAFSALLTDRYPPFGPAEDAAYPVRMHFAGPLPRYSRLKTFFRGILAIPIYIVRYVAQLMLNVCGFAAWFVCVLLGRLPRGLFDPMVLASSYIARSDAYLFLLTETYPPFQDAETRTAGLEHDRRMPEFES
jgi:hypothetical protein